jgi:polysaccharide chain length determinant protein (PEP-CTERM system associated)
MQESLRSVLVVLRDMWRRRWLGVGTAWIVGLAAAIVVMNVHERYEATSRIYVDTQTMLRPLMQGLTVEPDIDQMVAMLAKTLISRPKLEELVDRSNVGQGAHSPKEREAAIQYLTRNIRFASSGGNNIYEIAYRDTDPQRALRITNELVGLFVTSGKGDKIHDTEEARHFIEEQISVYEAKLNEAENRLKDFKLKNVAVLGASNQDYFSRMATTQQDLAQARVELRAAEESRDALQRELTGVDLKIDSGSAVSVTPDLDARLDSQRKQLDELRRRYTDDHPDVLAARRVIAQLQEERAQQIKSLTGSASPGPQLPNPVYQQIKVKYAEAEANVASLHGRVGELSNRLAQLQASAEKVPKVEAEMAQLNRDYDVIKHNYEQLVQRRETASISSDADAGARLAEFRVIEPPRIGPNPVFPSRLAMIALALVISLAAGVSTCYVLTQIMPTVQDARMLRQITARPVLGSISLLDSDSLVLGTRRSNLLFGISLVVLVAAYGAWVLGILLRMSSAP